MFRVGIATDNAAFCGGDGEPSAEARAAEVARILRVLADRIEHESRFGATEPTVILRDANGNRVGSAIWEN